MAFLQPRRKRWADMRDSSNETWSDSRSRTNDQQGAPRSDTLDSYQQPPIRDLDENSSASLNGRMQRSANLNRPSDFAFLLTPGSLGRGPREEEDDDDDARLGPTSSAAGTSRTGTGTWNRGSCLEGNLRDSELPRRALNRLASDSSNDLGGGSGARSTWMDHGFADGMDVEVRDTSPPARASSLAPLAVFGEACGKVAGGPSDFSFLLQTGPHKQEVSVCNVDMLDGGPEDQSGSGGGGGGHTTAGSEAAILGALPRKGHRRRANRKRRQTGDDDNNPEAAGRAKRNREGELDKPLGAANAPGAQVMGGGCEQQQQQQLQQQHQKMQQNEADDTVAHRLEKRRVLIEVIKRMPEYIAYHESRRDRESQNLASTSAAAPAATAATAGSVPAPRTPDPSDASISKKKWEEDVRLWKLAFRQGLPGSETTGPSSASVTNPARPLGTLPTTTPTTAATMPAAPPTWASKVAETMVGDRAVSGGG